MFGEKNFLCMESNIRRRPRWSPTTGWCEWDRMRSQSACNKRSETAPSMGATRTITPSLSIVYLAFLVIHALCGFSSVVVGCIMVQKVCNGMGCPFFQERLSSTTWTNACSCYPSRTLIELVVSVLITATGTSSSKESVSATIFCRRDRTSAA